MGIPLLWETQVTFENALIYFMNYGNLHDTLEELKREWSTATCGQLRNAAIYAERFAGRPREEIKRALIALIWRQ